ncbi:HAD family hydrolase [Corynebacterium kozikiae]|uniref:HAD family hydrolase n=1 Tax=Corynebacterium kozikiae TaxID=2968469 RepID=UPI00211BF3D5|nr:HAD-IB family hydrolase [Corynebacterium sp. 76QC2CO]
MAAFFDLDKTVIATSSALAFGKQFLHLGLITPAEALHMSVTKASYMLTGHNEQQMEATKEQLAQMVAGWEEAKVREIAAEAMHTALTPAIYAEARDLITEHQRQGHDVVIISASARQLVEPIATELGVDRVVATELEVVDGKFTGQLPFFCKGPLKAQAIAELAQTQHYDLQQCFAYTDSATDLPMLEAVGKPVAVNPDRALRKIATERGWEIQTFKNPVPLFPIPTKRELSISAGLVAALAFGAVWFTKRA